MLGKSKKLPGEHGLDTRIPSLCRKFEAACDLVFDESMHGALVLTVMSNVLVKTALTSKGIGVSDREVFDNLREAITTIEEWHEEKKKVKKR